MVWRPSFYTLFGGIAAAVSVLVALRARQHRSERAARAFTWLMIALGAWSFVYAIQLGYTTTTGQLAWQRAGLAIGGTIPTIWLVFTLEYVGKVPWLTKGKQALLALDPVLFGVLTLTNPVHALIWTDATLTQTALGPVVSLSFTIGYYAHILYAYLAIGAGLALLLLALTQASPVYRRQTGLLIAGATLPSLANIAYTLRVSWGPLPALDPTPFVFIVTGFLFGLALFQFDLLERTPIARQRVLEEMGDGLIVLDADGRIVETNDVAQHAFSRSLAVDGAGSALELDGSESRASTLRSLDGRTITRTHDGRERVYDVEWSPLTDHHGETVGHVLALRDVTDRNEYQRQIERLEEFASIVSHDLRSPLNVAKGHLELAQAESDNEHLQPIGDALDRMSEIIEDTLTLARQGQVVDDVEPIELSDVTHACWANVDTADATLSVDDDLAIYADPARLRSLFENLFRNAVEHAGDRVTVRIGDLDGAGFYVADDGPGIPTEDHEAIFEPGHSTTDQGTGFGLAIVEQIADAHDWHITVTASEHGGARFEVTGVELAN